MHLPQASKWHLDIDKYIDPLVPRNRLDRLPKPISRFLGYRDAPREPIGNVLIAFWSFIGAFAGTALLSALFMADFITDKGAPIMLGSYGAAAILEYNVIESPLSQPRNSILGHLLSAAIGVGITKLFALSDDFENLRWLAGALAVATASAAMTLTKTVHPPAGATALLAAVQPAVTVLGWWLLPITLLSTVITTGVACVLNNIQRQYPIYWWTPNGKITRVVKDSKADVEAASADDKKTEHDGDKLHKHGSKGSRHVENSNRICVDGFEITVPEHIYLSAEERGILQILQERLKEAEGGGSDTEVEEGDGSTVGRQDSTAETL